MLGWEEGGKMGGKVGKPSLLLPTTAIAQADTVVLQVTISVKWEWGRGRRQPLGMLLSFLGAV